MKRYVNILQKISEAYQYVVQNLTWSGVYLRRNLSSDLLQKILKLVPLKETGPEVYVATMITALYDYYDYLVDALNHMKSIKLKDHPGGNVTDFCDAILVDVERLESVGAFKPENLGYIIHIFEYNSGSKFHLWETHKYKEVMEFVKKPFLSDEDVMQINDIINYGFLVQEDWQEYSNIVESKR